MGTELQIRVWNHDRPEIKGGRRQGPFLFGVRTYGGYGRGWRVTAPLPQSGSKALAVCYNMTTHSRGGRWLSAGSSQLCRPRLTYRVQVFTHRRRSELCAWSRRAHALAAIGCLSFSQAFSSCTSVGSQVPGSSAAGNSCAALTLRAITARYRRNLLLFTCRAFSSDSRFFSSSWF